jgi:hypothetical protein
MGDPSELVGSFFITLASILVLGVTVLLILYKMIDGEFKLIPGLVAVFAVLLLFFVVRKAASPRHSRGSSYRRHHARCVLPLRGDDAGQGGDAWDRDRADGEGLRGTEAQAR